MKSDEINYLSRLSGSKLTLLNDLLNSTQEQAEILDREEEEKLEVSLKRRQDIINKIDLLDREFLKKYEALKTGLKVESLGDYKGDMDPGLKELQGKIGQIIEVTLEVQKLDKSNTEKLQENMSKVQEGIRTIRNNKKVTAGYKGYQEEVHSLFLDKKR